MRVIMTILIFLILGAFFIISNENLALKEKDNFETLKDRYLEWLGNLFDNTKDLTGYVINSDWLPKT